MPALLSFRLSTEQLEKCGFKAVEASEYCLNQFNGLLANLCDDEKAGASQSIPKGEPTELETKSGRATRTKIPSSTERSQASPVSQTAELPSLIDMDIPLGNPPAAPPTAGDSEVLDASSSSSSSSSSKRSSFNRRRKVSPTTPCIRAQAGEMITPRCRLGDASIEGDFASILFGTYNGRPACRIVVDFRLVFQPASTINWAQIQFRFGSNANKSGAQITKSFFPEELAGQYDTAQEIRAISPNIGLGVAGCKTNISGMSRQRARVERRQWRVQGTREEHSGIYDTFCWKVVENEFSEDSVPRHFRTGMVVYLPSPSPANAAAHNADFWVDISIEGTLRGLRSKHRKVQDRRWFEPTVAEMTCRDTLDADALANTVGGENQKIPDLMPKERTLDAGPTFPALPASVAASVDLPAKPAATAPPPAYADSGLTHATVTSDELLPAEGMVHTLAADQLVSIA